MLAYPKADYRRCLLMAKSRHRLITSRLKPTEPLYRNFDLLIDLMCSANRALLLLMPRCSWQIQGAHLVIPEISETCGKSRY